MKKPDDPTDVVVRLLWRLSPRASSAARRSQVSMAPFVMPVPSAPSIISGEPK